MSLLPKCIPFFPEPLRHTLVTIVPSPIQQVLHSLRLIDYQVLVNFHFKHGLSDFGGRCEEKRHHRVSLSHVRNNATVLMRVKIQETEGTDDGPRTAETFVHLFDQIRSFHILLSCTRLKVCSMPTLLED